MRGLLFVTAAVVVLFVPKVQGVPTDIFWPRNLVIREIGSTLCVCVRVVCVHAGMILCVYVYMKDQEAE